MIAYVFGYGSLLSGHRGHARIPMLLALGRRVTGYQRGWFHQFADNVGSTCTYSGAIEAKGKTVNGVIYKVSDFENTKARETGYTATPIKADQLTMLDGGGKLDIEKDANVYIFLSNKDSISKTKEPTAKFPIVQSYVDLCINGCLELDALYRSAKGFTQEFISTTTGWNANWVNDRIYPRRPFIYAPTAGGIDKALQAGNVLKYVQLHDLK